MIPTPTFTKQEYDAKISEPVYGDIFRKVEAVLTTPPTITEYAIGLDVEQLSWGEIEIHLSCDTTNGEIYIYLPNMNLLENVPYINFIISDFAKTCGTNPITVFCHPDNKIENKENFILNFNGSKVMAYVCTKEEYGVFVSPQTIA